MFNDKNFDSSPSSIWNLLGTFFNLLPDPGKQGLESYYESLNYVNQGLYHKLSQNVRMPYFKNSDGYSELLFQDIVSVFEDGYDLGRENTTKVFLGSPKNITVTGAAGSQAVAYKVTATNAEGESLASHEVSEPSLSFPITVSWDSVDGATGYKVYGRTINNHQLLYEGATASFTDSNAAFIDSSRPPKTPSALKGYNFRIDSEDIVIDLQNIKSQNSTELIKDSDFTLNNNVLFFPLETIAAEDAISPFINNFKFIEGVAKSILIISPIITNFYWRAFGDETGEYLRNWTYKPFLTSWDNVDAEMYANHIRYFSWAYSEALRKSPTLNNIKHAYSLILGYPFAYEAGEVTDVTGTVITIGDLVYDVGPGVPNVITGDTVKQFDILSTGITVEDWYSDSGLIEGLVSSDIEQKLALHLDSTHTFSHSTPMINFFKKTFLPAGLHLV